MSEASTAVDASEIAACRNVAITYEAGGVPVITTDDECDVAFGLGVVSARDRRLQMEFVLRQARGTLAALVGEAAAALDVSMRRLALAEAADAVLASLPGHDRDVLDAYAAGVNAWSEAAPPPYEAQRLGLELELWSASAAVTCLQVMALSMAGDGTEVRTLDVMRRCLPPAIVDFLTPGSGPFEVNVDGTSSAVVHPLPHEEIDALMAEARGRERPARPVVAGEQGGGGSNAWAVSAIRTGVGAVLANDMHLHLRMPPVWYHAATVTAGRRVDGVMSPGVPMFMAGASDDVAWGLTRIVGQTAEFVEVELDETGTHYRTEEGWEAVKSRTERVKIADGGGVDVDVRTTRWGPLTAELGDKPLAFHWTGLVPGGLDLGLRGLSTATDVDSAVDVARQAGGPTTNVLLAGSDGRIAWTVTGRYPHRTTPAAVTRPQEQRPWDTFVAADELPAVVDPPSGVLVNANNWSPAHGNRDGIGLNYFNSWRAHRVATALSAADVVDEAECIRLQYDSDASFYDFYRGLALQAASDAPTPLDLSRVERAVRAWRGTAATDEVGFGVLVAYRELLREALFSSLLGGCVDAEPTFTYAWHDHESPLRALLEAGRDGWTPAPYRRFSQFLAVELLVAAELYERDAGGAVDVAPWGAVNRAGIRHPLSRRLKEPGLDLPDVPVPGCPESVCVAWPGFGASLRFVASPGRWATSTMVVPGGQSGDPSSPHYADQWEPWLTGTALPVRPEERA